MDNSLVSVIIPVYNVEKYLRECVDSVIEQTYTNLEIILIDDGSPDNCGFICDEYASKDKRIRVIHKANGGLSDARNAGLDIATGEYISFVDSDDIIDVSFIKTLLTNIGDSDICFCNYYIFHGHEVIRNKEILDYERLKLSARKLLSELMTFHYPASVIACNKLYKRKLWKNLRFPIGKIHEDEFIIHKILDQCKNVVFIDIAMYYYRQRELSIMSSLALTPKSFLDKLEALSDRRQYFIQKKMVDEEFEINKEILFRCKARIVAKDNDVWRSFGLKAIVFRNSLPIRSKALLLLKKFNYSFYYFVFKIARGTKDQPEYKETSNIR